MQKILKTVTAMMLMVAVVVATGCTKPDDPSNPNNEGTYLFKKTEACYWGCYDRVWYCIRANEVRIEW